MMGQLPLSVRRLHGERVNCRPSKALFPSLNHRLFFPDHVHGAIPASVPCAAPNALNPNMARNEHSCHSRQSRVPPFLAVPFTSVLSTQFFGIVKLLPLLPDP